MTKMDDLARTILAKSIFRKGLMPLAAKIAERPDRLDHVFDVMWEKTKLDERHAALSEATFLLNEMDHLDSLNAAATTAYHTAQVKSLAEQRKREWAAVDAQRKHQYEMECARREAQAPPLRLNAWGRDLDEKPNESLIQGIVRRSPSTPLTGIDRQAGTLQDGYGLDRVAAPVVTFSPREIEQLQLVELMGITKYTFVDKTVAEKRADGRWHRC